jgi:predicted RNA-binding Zn ribbon-like protein
MWSQHVSILARSQAKRLLDEAGQRRSEAEAVFSRAIRLREVIYRIFSSIAGHSIPNKGDFAVLNEELSKAMAKIRITRNAQGYLWAFEDGEKALDQVLWPIVRSAADLLTSDRLDRIRSCADEECGWLFLDTSRNRSRRWCDMEDCGNRAKARRYYQRKHGISRRTTHNKTTRSV